MQIIEHNEPWNTKSNSHSDYYKQHKPLHKNKCQHGKTHENS